MEKPTPEFLEELLERARRYGNSGDWPAVSDFVRELYNEAGLQYPDLEPYDVIEWREGRKE